MKLKLPRQSGQRALQLLLLAALLLPALVPNGYMVARNDATDTVELTVCPGVAHHQRALETGSVSFDLDTTAEASEPGTASEEPAPCPLAISAMASLPEIYLPEGLAVRVDASDAVARPASQQTFYTLPPARAPPFKS